MRKIFLLLVIAATNCNAQTIDNFLSPAFPTNLTATADGKNIAWVFNYKGSRNVFVANATGSNATKITNYSGDDGIDMMEINLYL